MIFNMKYSGLTTNHQDEGYTKHATEPIFAICERCLAYNCDPDDVQEYKKEMICGECYIAEKLFEIGTPELVVSRCEYGGWECKDKQYDGAPDSGCVIAHGNTIQEAIDSYLEFAIEMKHDIDPGLVEYSWAVY